MSEFNLNVYTLLDRAKDCGEDGKTVQDMLDVMQVMGVPDFLPDVPAYPTTHGLKSRILRNNSIPTSTRRKLYNGVVPNKADKQVVWEDVVLFEQRSEIDEAALAGMSLANQRKARKNNDDPHKAGLLKDVVYAVFNDSKSSGDGQYFDGFAARATTLSYPGYATKSSFPYIWDNGGGDRTGYLSSMWIVEWGPQANHLLYPEGEGALGLSMVDHGKEPIVDADDSTAKYYAWVSQFKMWAGLACWDDRKWARIANIDSDETQTKIIDTKVVIKALTHGQFNTARTRIYVNPFIQTQIDILAESKSNTVWGTMEVFGKKVPSIRGIPIRVLDEAILDANETAIS